MKIMPSLRLYFFISVVLLGSAMAIGFSFLSANYYIDGLDRGINSTMFELAKNTQLIHGQSKDFASFNIASSWQDTPDIIQQRFKTPPMEEGRLHKIKDQGLFFTIPKNIFFVVLHRTAEGEQRFVSKVILEKDIIEIAETNRPTNPLIWALLIAIFAVAVFSIFLFMIMQKVTKPVESLKDWAKSLNQETLKNAPPDFNYNELNILATLIQDSLLSAHQSLEREQRFLSYASHEIRTPIAVIRSNVDLLQRLNEKQPANDKQQLTLQRIQRAGLNLSNLTDTLLWLSRNEDIAIAPEPVDLSKIIHQACNDLGYLLDGKNVDVEIEAEQSSVNVVSVACQIVINNLIRNAYQHTQEGYVTIKQLGSCITIINTNVTEDNDQFSGKSVKSPIAFGHGYGLGLQLSEKIITHHNWQYSKHSSQGSYRATIDFENR
ncbi:sensor histidine kinase [Paraglaciecola arctica]|uniref:sensor histidine kinase n=1 Tax=Paraglaciecola arctica TaxID=1128911 RepID=UPI001C067EC6|nr:HAMP domain-containing sensor histidine kinase [Paraglaciecola arctica]MBU3002304.1 HAMP domain-containing histidine kinase [Paraglaciecola arctica]